MSRSSPWRRWTALGIRTVVLLCAGVCASPAAMAAPVEGMNVFFVLDRSDSVPSPQQDAARQYVNKVSRQKKSVDKAA